MESFTDRENDAATANLQSCVTEVEKVEGKASSRVKVSVRIRPINEREEKSGAATRFWEQDEDKKTLCEKTGSEGTKAWRFDRVFAEETNTEQVYKETIAELVQPVINGVHGTALVYGQTSSGKTHTMFGAKQNIGNEPAEQGAVHLALRDLFDTVEKESARRTFDVEISYVEVYNEVIGDLLHEESDTVNAGNATSSSRPSTPVLGVSRTSSPFRSRRPAGYGSLKKTSSKPVSIREDTDGGVSLSACRKKVQSFQEALDVLACGAARRHIASTGMNERSSRSHTILTVHVKSLETESKVQRTAQLHLVDLAGSESMKTSNASGSQVQEAKSINQSLLALAMVVSSLAQSGNGKSTASHVSFRNSKLTRILKPALSGESLVSIICCITPSLQFVEETRSTLQFARTARKIQVSAKPNETVSAEMMVVKLKREIHKLRRASSMHQYQQPPSTFRSAVDPQEQQDPSSSSSPSSSFESSESSLPCAKRTSTSNGSQTEEIERLKQLLIASIGWNHNLSNRTAPTTAPSRAETGTSTSRPLGAERRYSEQWARAKSQTEDHLPKRRQTLLGFEKEVAVMAEDNSVVELHNKFLREKVAQLRLDLEEEKQRREEQSHTLREALREAQSARRSLEERCSRLDGVVEENLRAFRDMEKDKALQREKLEKVLEQERLAREAAQNKLEQLLQQSDMLEKNASLQRREIVAFEEKLANYEECEMSLREELEKQYCVEKALKNEKAALLEKIQELEDALIRNELEYSQVVCNQDKLDSAVRETKEANTQYEPTTPVESLRVQVSLNTEEIQIPDSPCSVESFCTAHTAQTAASQGTFFSMMDAQLESDSLVWSPSSGKSFKTAAGGMKKCGASNAQPLAKWCMKKQLQK